MPVRICVLLLLCSGLVSARSVPQRWVEATLEAIAADGRGPTVHSRNLFHLGAAMYDAWAWYHPPARPWLLGTEQNGYTCDCAATNPVPEGQKIDSLVDVAISYAAFRLLTARFETFSGKTRSFDHLFAPMEEMGLPPYPAAAPGSATWLGMRIAECYLAFGLEDGAHENDDFEDLRYSPMNPLMEPDDPGPGNLPFPNLWQPLKMERYVEGRGGDPSLPTDLYLRALEEQVFLNAEWGEVYPFALTDPKMLAHRESGEEYQIYLDPGPPPRWQPSHGFPETGSYRWGFLLVALWSGHVDPADSVYLDISPASRKAPEELPAGFHAQGDLYNLLEGGFRAETGHRRNPATGQPYAPQRVLRGDYCRVLAEYWADALNTSTPPGHWFGILNDAMDHPEFSWKWEGKGKQLSQQEFAVKAYFALGAAVHDAGIAAWSVKGAYDYVRPISAIRYMAQLGQSSDSTLPHYHPGGMPLIPGKVELVKKGDPLAGPNREHLHKVKLWAWKGPDAIADFEKDMAGVGWILAENWWPYQRYSAPTPNFAGYVSGHSTFSYAAAEVIARMTGDPYFPGGMASYHIPAHTYLKFERGPSRPLTLQWATYMDAAHETALSRIWGGIHPPADDLPGRRMGLQAGRQAFDKVNTYFGK